MSMLTPLGRRRNQTEDLVELLLECHERIRTFAKLAVMLGERADVPADEVVESCARCARYFTQALPLHVKDEEESLLPRLRGLGPEVDDALAAMHRQHQEHGPYLAELLRTLAGLRANPADETSRAALHAAAVTVTREFEAHLSLEEGILFPAVRAHVPAHAQRAVVAELRARRV